MPNIASALKAEIERLARKETRRQMAPVSKASAGHRRQIAALKRELARLDKRISAASKVPKTVVRSAPDSAGDGADVRFQARGLRPLRTRLGLSAAEFARLLDVSQQSVYNWELGNAWNTAQDWYFENTNFTGLPNYTYSDFLKADLERGMQRLVVLGFRRGAPFRTDVPARRRPPAQ